MNVGKTDLARYESCSRGQSALPTSTKLTVRNIDVLMSTNHQDVLDSYHRCEAAGGLFDTFYDIFFAKSPEIPPKFAKTDMERQKQDVMASVLMALRLATGDPAARKYTQEIAESHSRERHDIRPELYGLWLDALCEAIRSHDPRYTPELEKEWRQAMRPAIELMIAAY